MNVLEGVLAFDAAVLVLQQYPWAKKESRNKCGEPQANTDTLTLCSDSTCTVHPKFLSMAAEQASISFGRVLSKGGIQRNANSNRPGKNILPYTLRGRFPTSYIAADQGLPRANPKMLLCRALSISGHGCCCSKQQPGTPAPL